MEDIVLVTGNLSKLKEYQKIISENLKSKDIDLDEIQSMDLKEISEHKVKQAYDILKCPVIVDDSSFFLDDLNGLPGPFLKYFEKNLGNGALIRLLGDSKNRSGRQVVMVTYYNGKNLIFCEGVVEGDVTYDLREGEGFGFDYCFIPKGYDKTYSQLGLDEKNKISGRVKAIEILKKELEKLN